LSLHHKIIDARKNKGLTQEELAARAHVTVRTIQRIESGDTIPRDFTLKALATALHIPFEELAAKEDVARPATQPAPSLQDARHFLHMVNLSSFAYLVLPFVHFLIPAGLLKNGKQYSATARETGRKIVRVQIYWVIATNLLLLLTALLHHVLSERGHHHPQWFQDKKHV
jgi:transcriptional regulator with XRE-family HTH domain